MTITDRVAELYGRVAGAQELSEDPLLDFLRQEISDITDDADMDNYDMWCEAVEAIQRAQDDLERLLALVLHEAGKVAY